MKFQSLHSLSIALVDEDEAVRKNAVRIFESVVGEHAHTASALLFETFFSPELHDGERVPIIEVLVDLVARNKVNAGGVLSASSAGGGHPPGQVEPSMGKTNSEEVRRSMRKNSDSTMLNNSWVVMTPEI